MADFEDWLDSFDAFYRALPASPNVTCPSCGRQALRLIFTARSGSDVGYAAFYCESCLQGIHLSRVVIAPGAVVRDAGLPFEEREPRIPDYVVVQ